MSFVHCATNLISLFFQVSKLFRSLSKVYVVSLPNISGSRDIDLWVNEDIIIDQSKFAAKSWCDRTPISLAYIRFSTVSFFD